jgi:hypothetical protein
MMAVLERARFRAVRFGRYAALIERRGSGKSAVALTFIGNNPDPSARGPPDAAYGPQKRFSAGLHDCPISDSNSINESEHSPSCGVCHGKRGWRLWGMKNGCRRPSHGLPTC